MSNILFLLKVPPPIHGSTLMSKIVGDSTRICSEDNRFYLKQSISSDVSDIGRVSIRKIGLIFKNYFKLCSLLFKNKIHLVYFAISPTGKAFLKDFLSVLIIKMFRSRIVFHFHGKGIQEQSKSKIYKYLYKLSFKNELAIILAESIKYDIEEFAWKEIFVLPNGITDYSDIEISQKTTHFTITFLANFFRNKGINEFLEVIKMLKESDYNFRVNIIGQPKDVSIEDIHRFINKYELTEQILNVGPLYGSEKFSALSKSDLFIYPTKNDCYPLVLIEAMQFGLPIITSFEGGIPDIVEDKVNGYLIEPDAVQEMFMKTVEFMQDPIKHNRFSKNSREKYLRNNTIDIFEKNLDLIFNKILNQYDF